MDEIDDMIKKSGGKIPKKDMWELGDELQCDCGGWMKPTYLKIEGMKVRGWQCPKCKAVNLHTEDAQKMLLFNKLKHAKVEVTVGVVGNAEMIRIPKNFTEVMNLKKGEKVHVKLKTPKEMLVSVA